MISKPPYRSLALLITFSALYALTTACPRTVVRSEALEPTSTLLVRNSDVGEYFPSTGKIESEVSLDERPYPYNRFETGTGGSIYSWVDKYNAMNLAVLDKDLNVLFSRKRTYISARLGPRLIVETLDHLGPEGIFPLSSQGSEVWNVRTGEVEASYPGLGRFDALGTPRSRGREVAASVILAGMDEGREESHTWRNAARVLKLDLASGKEIFDTILEKKNPDYLSLLTDTDTHSVFHYFIGITKEEVIVLDRMGEIAWTLSGEFQLYNVLEYPFYDALFHVPIALDVRGDRLALYTRHLRGPARVRIFRLSTGEIILEREMADAPGAVTSMEFVSGKLLVNFRLGAAAWLIDPSGGEVETAEPTESPPVIVGESPGKYELASSDKNPVIATLEGSSIEFKWDGKERVVSFSPSAGRTLESFARARDAPGILNLAFSESALAHEFGDNRKYAAYDLDAGEWVFGDELDPAGWQYLTNTSVVIAGEHLYKLSSGKVEMKVALFAD